MKIESKFPISTTLLHLLTLTYPAPQITHQENITLSFLYLFFSLCESAQQSSAPKNYFFGKNTEKKHPSSSSSPESNRERRYTRESIDIENVV